MSSLGALYFALFSFLLLILFLQFSKGGSAVLNAYDGDVVKALNDLFPEVLWIGSAATG